MYARGEVVWTGASGAAIVGVVGVQTPPKIQVRAPNLNFGVSDTPNFGVSDTPKKVKGGYQTYLPQAM